MSVANIRSALVTAFVAGSFFDAAHTALENINYEPPTAGPYCSLFFVPAAPSVATLGTGGRDQQNGFLQIDLNYPTNSGTKGADDKYEALRLLYKAGAKFSYSGQEVTITSCGRSQGRIVNGFYKVVVTVMFYAQINR